MGKNNFAGIAKTFSEFDTSKIVILPIRYDKTSTWIKGADKGPFALLEASCALEWYDIETDTEVYKNGIYIHPPVETEVQVSEMVLNVEKVADKLLCEDKFIVGLGGEHSVSIGLVNSFKKKFKNISVLQLDAHADLRDEYENSKFNHACVGKRIMEKCPLVQVGLRSMDISERNVNDKMFFAHDIMAKNNDAWIKQVIDSLTDNVYVTIDLDVFDPSIIPATGTPEPGGLGWYQVTRLLKELAKSKKVLGFDVVELCPRETDKVTDFIAAKLVYKFLSYIWALK